MTLLTPLVALVLTATAPTLDDVLAKNYAARGGLDKLRAIKTLRVRGHTEGGWATFDVTTTYARTSKSRQDVSMQGMTESSAVDGKSGWQTNAFSGRKDAVAMSPDDLLAALDDADFDGPLVDWQKKGHKLELLGSEDVDGSPAWKIKATLKSGTVQYIFLDADAFIEIKTITQRRMRGALVETETELGNYEQVGGVFFPFSIENRARRSQNPSRFAVDKVEVDPPVDDALFAKPGGAK